MTAPQSESMIRKTPKARPQPENFYPQPPASPENGQQIALPAGENAGNSRADQARAPGISIHEGPPGGQITPPPESADATDLDELVTSAIRRAKRGRPAAFDDHAKGKLVALLALGLSLRQAASVLGVCHATIRNTLQADPALVEEITAAKFSAQVQPLACVVRESRRSWKAATWLLKYLDGKIGGHEETPEEARERKTREFEESIARTQKRMREQWIEEQRAYREKS